jgi:hypothetical protein
MFDLALGLQNVSYVRQDRDAPRGISQESTTGYCRSNTGAAWDFGGRPGPRPCVR